MIRSSNIGVQTTISGRGRLLQTCLGLMMMVLMGIPALVDAVSGNDRGVIPEPVEAPATAECRIALVIGNGAYKDSPLRNPVNDAKDMGKILSELGFEVTQRVNLSQKEMIQAIQDFGVRLREGGVGLFYFAGHGVQVKGENYIIPVEARIEREEQVEYEAVRVGRVLAEMEIARNRLNIVILDACRNNPFARSFRSPQQGLAYMNAPSGTLIAYATAPGSVALDGSGENGLYTQELIKNIKTPGLKIEDMFKNVRISLDKMTNGQQQPWESTSLKGDFYFSPSVTSVPQPVTPGSGAVVPTPQTRPPVDKIQEAPSQQAVVSPTTKPQSLPPQVTTPSSPPPDSRLKLALFPWTMKGSRPDFSQRVLGVLNEVVGETRQFIVAFDYHTADADKLSLGGKLSGSDSLDPICRKASELGVNAVLVYSFNISERALGAPKLEGVEVDLIDVEKKARYSAERSVSLYLSHPDPYEEIRKVTRKVFEDYRKGRSA